MTGKQQLHTPRDVKGIRKYYLWFNIIFMILGIGLIVMAGVSVIFDRKLYENLQMKIGEYIRILLYAVGCWIALNAILGFLALYKHKATYLWIFYCVDLLALSIMLSTSFGSTINIQTPLVKKKMYDLMKNYEIYENAETLIMDKIQTQYECCGVESFKDWQDVKYGRISLKVPLSCCKLKNESVQEKDPVESNELSPEDIDFDSCGDLCLPSHVDVSSYLDTIGCFYSMFGVMEIYFIFMAWYCFLLGVLCATAFLLTAYLIGTSRI